MNNYFLLPVSKHRNLDLNKFQVKFTYDGHNGTIQCINSYFYEFFYCNKKLYVYDEYGNLYKEIQTEDKAFLAKKKTDKILFDSSTHKNYFKILNYI